MVSLANSSDQQYRVAVTAIVGGPFDLRKNQLVLKSAIADWADSLLRLGAIEQVNEGTGDTPHSPSPQ
jgi:hypothetical protein